MKANALEKIYIACDVVTEEGRAFILEHPVSYLKSIEYTRTDAFIEKVENFLEMLGCGFTITDNITHTNYGKKQLVEDFRKYMEG